MSQELYIVYSLNKLEDIRDFLISYAEVVEDVGIMRFDHDRDESGIHIKTDRIIVSLHPSIYEELKNEGYHKRNEMYDFYIKEYEIRYSNYPPNNSSFVLFIQLPLCILSFEECKRKVKNILHEVSQLSKLIDENEYQTFFYQEKKICLVNLDKDKLIYQKNKDRFTKFKILLDQSKWIEGDNNHIMRVSWCKKSLLRNEFIQNYNHL